MASSAPPPFDDNHRLIKQEDDDDGEETNPLHHQQPRISVAPPHAITTTTGTPPLPLRRTTVVDGQGMWRSWTRVFAKPESACLDLLDNCFDAAAAVVAENKQNAKVSMESWGDNGIAIRNNSAYPIPSLEIALTVYKSSKNKHHHHDNDDKGEKDAIGENGVGLKHGCATLSDCSIVLTKNERMVQVGVIAKGLQTPEGVYLPSFSFTIRSSNDITNFRRPIENWLAQHADILHVLQQAWGNTVNVYDQLTELAQSLWKGIWLDEDHVFLVVLSNLKKSADVPHVLIQSIRTAKTFLQEIRTLLPEYYINLAAGAPPSCQLDFLIDRQPVVFHYWQHRLVELTRFRVHISPDEPLETLSEEDWDQPGPTKYPLSIYCGFDAQRLLHSQTTTTSQGQQQSAACELLLYSCQAGRLIQKITDARSMLGLNHGGVDFTQGLTVIVNDVAGILPLTPTKDAIAWSERKNGEIHQRNLMAWIGAVARLFWMHHKSKFNNKGENKAKEFMKKTICSFAVEELAQDNTTRVPEKNMEEAHYTEFENIKWKRVRPNFNNHWKIRSPTYQNLTTIQGPDTLFTVTHERIRRIKEEQTTRRKSATAAPSNATGKKRGRDVAFAKDAEPDRSWTNVDPSEISRVAAGVLRFLRARDKDNIFEDPVLETMPELKEAYLKVVSTPMDFRTIEKERVQKYTSPEELRQDLTLTFSNCIEYNGATSMYGKQAQNMLDCLDEAFESTDLYGVVLNVLVYLREMDKSELFATPVLEQVPQIEHEYLREISHPMDFRTIEQERASSYRSIEELRQDLVLIFENCIRYSGAESTYGEFAQEMMNELDGVIQDVIMGKRRRRSKKVRYDKIVSQRNVSGENKVKASRKRSAGRKHAPTNSLERQFQIMEKKLEAERMEVQKLRAKLAASEERICQLESQQGISPTDRAGSACDSPSESDWSSALAENSDEDEGCHECGFDNEHDCMLICEGCENEYHFYCLNPPLTEVPNGDWYCGKCAKQSSAREFVV